MCALQVGTTCNELDALNKGSKFIAGQRLRHVLQAVASLCVTDLHSLSLRTDTTASAVCRPRRATKAHQQHRDEHQDA